MVSPVSLLPIAYLCCGLLPLLLVPYIRSAGAKPGRTGLFVTLGGLSVWSISVGLLVVLETPMLYLGLATLFGLGSQLAAVGYFLMAAEYTGTLEATRRVLGGITAIVVTIQLLSVTDPLHQLVWAGSVDPPLAKVEVGVLGVAIGGLTFAVGGAALCLLVIDTVTTSGVRRKQSFTLVVAGVPTMVFFLADATILADAPYPILPFGLVGSAFAYAWALFRVDFLDIVPVGRKHIVKEMSDAAVVVDANDRVVECNPAARRLVGTDTGYAGTPIDQFFGSVPDAVKRFRGESGIDTEITVCPDGEPRHFHLKISQLESTRSSAAAGRLIVLRDITTLKRRERALERRESELEFLRQVLARVLRHNIRNDLTAIRGYAELIAAEGTPKQAAMAETIVETSDELLETSRKARLIEQVIDREPVAEQLDLAAGLKQLVDGHRSRYEHATIALDGPDRCLVDTDPWLESAFDILLENAIEHNDGEPTVNVRLECTATDTIVRIEDDGPGIPADELTVLAQGEETPLEHASGIGLWIVHWIVDTAGASVSFETDDEGTRVSVRIPATASHSVSDDDESSPCRGVSDGNEVGSR